MISHLRFVGVMLLLFFFACRPVSQEPESEDFTYTMEELRAELERRYDLDQEMRRTLVDSIGMDSPEASGFMGKIFQQDQDNQAFLRKVLDKYGWLPISEVGEKANSAIFYIVQHSDQDMMSRYFPQLKELASRGEANPRHAAMMEDRLLMWQGKKQIYGTQASRIGEDTTYYIWPVEDPNRVNARRQSVGITTTIEDYAASMKAIWDPGRELPGSKD